MRTGTPFIGTSGFAYDEWRGSFYPLAIKAKEMLPFYSRRFSSVEINYTFRRLPSPKTLASWREATPESFVFAVKAHQQITHVLRLAGADDSVVKFLDALAPLGERTGPLLFQCPPGMKLDHARLESFLALLQGNQRCVFEFRHPSWIQARPLLESRGFGWCVTESDETGVSEDALTTGPFLYLRLRRTEYDDAQLARWAQRIDDALENGRDVYCYFKHEDAGKGVRFAEQLRSALAAR